VAEADAIGWLDVRADWDWLSIHLRDPLTASGIPSPGPDRPAVIRVRIQDLIDAELLARRKWNLFQMHFQLLMSSRDPAAFDYIVFVAGPEPIHAMVVSACRPTAAPDAPVLEAAASTLS
jgi:hypothetical protein